MNKQEALSWLVENVHKWPTSMADSPKFPPVGDRDGTRWEFYGSPLRDAEFVVHGEVITKTEWLDFFLESSGDSLKDSAHESLQNMIKPELFRGDKPNCPQDYEAEAFMNSPERKEIDSTFNALICAIVGDQKTMKHVIIESPYAGNVADNINYARQCMRDSLKRGEAPYASHLLYTQANVLDDNIPEERELGILAGFAWKHIPDVLTVFYADKGFSNGMRKAVDYCNKHDRKYEVRFLGESDE